MGLACSVNFMAHDYGWDLKCFLFGAVVIGFIFAPSTAFGLLGYGWLVSGSLCVCVGGGLGVYAFVYF